MLSYVISLTLLTLAVIVLRGVFRNKMSSRLVYALWLAVIIRIVLPFDVIQVDRMGVDYLGVLESAADNKIVISVENESKQTKKPINGNLHASTSTVEQETAEGKNPILNSGSINQTESGNIQSNELLVPEISTDKEENGISDGNASTPVPETADGVAEETSIAGISVKEILNTVWFAGATVTASVFALSWIFFSLKLVKTRKFLMKSGAIKVYVSERVSSSCVCGIIPKIYVTPEARDSEAISTVILHEKVHVSHGDIIWNIFRTAAVSVFWWNPVIWVAAILSKRDAEFACDETVARKLDGNSKLEYARLIVDMTPVKKNCAVSFSGGPVKERVLKLTKKQKNTIIIAVAVVLLIIICCVTAFVGTNYVSDNGGSEIGTTEGTGSVENEGSGTGENEGNGTGENEVVHKVEGDAFEVLEATAENIARYASAKKYDVSSREYNFSLILVASRDVTDFRINHLYWNEDLIVENEEVIEKVGDVKEGDALLITTDSVEIIGYVGISYTDNGKTERYYPATSGKDGSAILADINENRISLGNPSVKPSSLHLEKAETDDRYKFICALLSRDVETLGKWAKPTVAGNNDSRLQDYISDISPLKDIVFSAYNVEEDKNSEDALIFTFTISESSYDPLPAGDYKLLLSEGIFFKLNINYLERPGIRDTKALDEDERFFALTMFDAWYELDFTNLQDNLNYHPTFALFYIYRRAHGNTESLTMAQLESVAKEVYNVPDFKVNTSYLFVDESAGDLRYIIPGMGGTSISYDVIGRSKNNDTVTYTVRYYSDFYRIGSGRVVNFVIEKTDTEYGFKLVDIKEESRSSVGILAVQV